MQDISTKPAYRIYPAYCFRSSPTYNTWVKLSISDTHGLRDDNDFIAQNIYFYLNHPIRYVCIVGVVVAIDDIASRYTILTLDDGSGATIEAKLLRVVTKNESGSNISTSTNVSNVSVIDQLGIYSVRVDKHEIDIGTVLKVKGTIAIYRDVKQLVTQRLFIVRTTEEEAKAWKQMSEFKKEVLDTPWRLTKGDHHRIKQEIRAERKAKAKEEAEFKAQEEKYEREKREQEKRRRARLPQIRRYEAQLESKRAKQEALLNEGALI
ncbi:hypothetical protein M011DRAFT_460698 [Sporormia fimetaria CBS 119925]|uniref:CST complex subunit Stn1 N-terminal domain-containing protein n=1 Tax=Sporormia fimetaria CBS 119925 TaxID=1340428 RepID=A0A6A6V4E2_9PLEO|nr:hypothetical protein M011DRAFT_460698 [Sporormia fimetaria CBS 119925]